jgi:hypothetical protein
MIDVWTEAHDAGRAKGGTLSDEEKEEIWDWMQSRPAVPLTLAEAKRQRGNGHGG